MVPLVPLQSDRSLPVFMVRIALVEVVVRSAVCKRAILFMYGSTQYEAAYSSTTTMLAGVDRVYGKVLFSGVLVGEKWRRVENRETSLAHPWVCPLAFFLVFFLGSFGSKFNFLWALFSGAL